MRFLLEVGVEELPALLVPAALEELRAGMETVLAGLKGEGASLEVTATPRRLVALADGLVAKEAEEIRLVRGPSLARARDEEGRWTKAALGFAASHGVLPEQLLVREGYLYAERQEGGRPTLAVLAERLPSMLGALRFPRSMRWGLASPRFIRPVRWIVALLEGEVVPFTFAGVRSGRVTRGLRYQEPFFLTLPEAAAYHEVLATAGILVDRLARRQRIESELRRAAGADEPLVEEALLAELTDLTERPQVLRGVFPAEFLELPEVVLATTMTHHQRFVPLRRDGRLHHAFLAVANGGDPERVRRGNERVLRARLADAAFFFAQDRKRPLAEYLAALDRITYLEGVGTLGARARRLERLAGMVAEGMGALPAEVAVARRAGLLAEADRATEMVREFPELGGTMGAIYARLSGEPEEVAEAIAQSILPRPGERELPKSLAGRAVALAARLDHVAAGFAAGLQPRGSADPYGLRRAAIGALQLLNETPIPLPDGVRLALAPFSDRSVAEETVLSFFEQRLLAILEEEGIPAPVAQAVVAVGVSRVDETFHRAELLSRLLRDAPELLRDVMTVYRRSERLAVEDVAPAEDPPERALAQAIAEVRTEVERARQADRWEDVVRALARLRGPIDRFFDEVLVMDPDPEVQRRRRALLGQVLSLVRLLADFQHLSGLLAEVAP